MNTLGDSIPCFGDRASAEAFAKRVAAKMGKTTMTIKQVIEKCGGTKDDWHQHPNGGGWVHRSARVARSAEIRGVVCQRAVVGDRAAVGDDAVVGFDRPGPHFMLGIEVPVIENIDSAILKAVRTEGNRLNMGAWHDCETTHCRAGWAITLAGDKGRNLEAAVGSEKAGRLIYAVSRPGMNTPNFFASNEDAMKDLEACAAREQGKQPTDATEEK